MSIIRSLSRGLLVLQILPTRFDPRPTGEDRKTGEGRGSKKSLAADHYLNFWNAGNWCHKVSCAICDRYCDLLARAGLCSTVRPTNVSFTATRGRQLTTNSGRTESLPICAHLISPARKKHKTNPGTAAGPLHSSAGISSTCGGERIRLRRGRSRAAQASRARERSLA
jgi:hypothetical protein